MNDATTKKGLLFGALSKEYLAARRQAKTLHAQGYQKYEVDWRLVRGGLLGSKILDVVISHDGKHVFAKIGKVDDARHDD